MTAKFFGVVNPNKKEITPVSFVTVDERTLLSPQKWKDVVILVTDVCGGQFSGVVVCGNSHYPIGFKCENYFSLYFQSVSGNLTIS